MKNSRRTAGGILYGLSCALVHRADLKAALALVAARRLAAAPAATIPSS